MERKGLKLGTSVINECDSSMEGIEDGILNSEAKRGDSFLGGNREGRGSD